MSDDTQAQEPISLRVSSLHGTNGGTGAANCGNPGPPKDAANCGNPGPPEHREE